MLKICALAAAVWGMVRRGSGRCLPQPVPCSYRNNELPVSSSTSNSPLRFLIGRFQAGTLAGFLGNLVSRCCSPCESERTETGLGFGGGGSYHGQGAQERHQLTGDVRGGGILECGSGWEGSLVRLSRGWRTVGTPSLKSLSLKQTQWQRSWRWRDRETSQAG